MTMPRSHESLEEIDDPFQSLEQIGDILEKREFDTFRNRPENQIFDAKQLLKADFQTDPNERYELLKDVSSFANADGGYIVYGLTTKKVEAIRTDVVSDITWINPAEFNKGKIDAILREHIYPPIKGLIIDFVENPIQPTQGLGYIFIPFQLEGEKFFLVHSIIEDTVALRKIVFGLAIRNDDKSEPFDIMDLYRQVRRGRQHDIMQLEEMNVVLRLLVDRVEELTSEIRELKRNQGNDTTKPLDRLSERLGDLAESENED